MLFSNSNNTGWFDKKDYVILPKISLDNFSLCIWVKYYKAKNYDYGAAIFSIGDGSGKYFILYCNSNNGELWADYNAIATSKSDISDGKWHFITVAKSTGLITLYVDGDEIDSKAVTDYSFVSKTAYFSYHQWYNGGNGSSRFYGVLDEAHLYNRCLSSTEILSMYKNDKNNVADNSTTVTPIITKGKWDEVSSISTDSLSIKLEWKLDKNTYRTNPDKSKFYKTELRLLYNNGVKENEYYIPDKVYSEGQLDGGGTPCMLIDPTNETITVFIQEKDYSSSDYGMSGYAYILNKGATHFVKETIFTRCNYGWFAFFGGSDNGNPTLCHFSCSGYKSIESVRNSSGTWSNYTLGSVTTDAATKQYKTHKNILITDQKNVDKMSGVTSSTRTINTIYDPPSSNSSTVLSEDEKLGLFVGGLFLVGAAIYKGLESLPASSGSSSSSSYSSSSSSSTSSATCYDVVKSGYSTTICGISLPAYTIHCTKKDEDIIIAYYPVNSSGTCIFNKDDGWYSHGTGLSDTQWYLITRNNVTYEEAAKKECGCD